jgi:hypothetical protein
LKVGAESKWQRENSGSSTELRKRDILMLKERESKRRGEERQTEGWVVF